MVFWERRGGDSRLTDSNNDHAAIPQLDPALLDQLRVEFGDNGSRAVGFLETARRASVDWPFFGVTNVL